MRKLVALPAGAALMALIALPGPAGSQSADPGPCGSERPSEAGPYGDFSLRLEFRDDSPIPGRRAKSATVR